MHKVEINLLRLEERDPKPTIHKPRSRSHPLLPSLFGLIGVALIVLSATTALSYQQSKEDTSALNQVLQSILFGSRPQFGEVQDRKLNGEADDRINVLLLGVGGKNHDGAQLSDTNILLSVQPSSRSAAFVSIPRDLLVPIDGYGWRKINNANAFAEMKQEGSGIMKAAAVVSKILNIPVHYTLRVDFDGFVEIVNILGGLDVTVNRAFTDYSYPTENYKYQTISFQAGPQTMDGDRALIFVRSRHSGMNNEGSDFARSARQQKIIAAVKEKIFSPSFLLNPQKISDVLSSLHDHIATDIKPSEFLRFLSLARSIDQDRMSALVFDDGPDNYLVSGSVEGAYVLQPRDGTFEQMQIAVRDIFKMEIAKNMTNKILGEHPTVSIQNGTSAVGLAGRLSTHLAKAGYTVLEVANAQSKAVTATQLIDQSDGSKKHSKVTLLELLPPSTALVGSEQQPFPVTSPQSDFLIVLGTDAIELLTGQSRQQHLSPLPAVSTSPASVQ